MEEGKDLDSLPTTEGAEAIGCSSDLASTEKNTASYRQIICQTDARQLKCSARCDRCEARENGIAGEDGTRATKSKGFRGIQREKDMDIHPLHNNHVKSLLRSLDGPRIASLSIHLPTDIGRAQ